jgi:hypothetical protein
MAHFAHIEDRVVTTVIVVSNDDAPDEPTGQAFIASLGLPGEWRQTSYNGTFRYNYAGIGYLYDQIRDAFIPPQPYPSWVLDESTCLWEPPVPYPSDPGPWAWNEEEGAWQPVEE